MSLYRAPDGAVLFNCFRVHCGVHGAVRTGTADGSLDNTQVHCLEYNSYSNSNSNAITHSNISLSPLGLRDYSYYWIRYNLLPMLLDSNRVRFCSERNRFYLPCYNMLGVQFGYELKHRDWLGPLSGPKSLFYFTGEPCAKLHVPKTSVPAEDTIVLVEDTISAIRLGVHVPTGSLLGTNLCSGGVDQLLSRGVRNVYILLDGDATSKAVRLMNKWCLAFDNIVAVPLVGPDVKDMTDRELDQLLLTTRLYEVYNRYA